MPAGVVRAAIHPGIGIARVGNSPHEYFIGPEVSCPEPVLAGFYKDPSGALKRQAARFRLYGYDESGHAVEELTGANARITWTVHVANKKAAWYNFERALDITEAMPCGLRNVAFVGDARQQLTIDPGPRSIAGSPGQDPQRFDSGRFLGEPVYLGEIRTDDAGNLLFLGGHGVSRTPFPNNTAYTFANNDGWHDDIADGPVTADVEIDGRKVPVDPAWVVVAPPNYAPDIISVQTMHDVLYDAYQGVWIAAVETPSFTRHIYPLLRQFWDAQWVNAGFYSQFGWRAPYDFLRPDYLRKLATITRDGTTITDIYREQRRQVFHLFRNPAATFVDDTKWPQMYGDAPDVSTPDSDLSLTKTQYNFLQQWATGNFRDDWSGEESLPRRLDDVPLRERPETLDTAALRFCLGGPFHPGCEMTWVMRTPTMYYAPFRVRPRAAGQPEPDYGDTLMPTVGTGESGPLHANGPGDLTRWMAVPWQTDTASCRSGYDKQYDPYLPTFWPARVPNHVLGESHYRKMMDGKLSDDERRDAFDVRSVWLRGLKGEWIAQINQMIMDFGKLGVVERREGPGHPDFPDVVYVESTPGFDAEAPPRANLVIGPTGKIKRHRRREPGTIGNSRAVSESA
jgi:hypothetical protein